MKRPGGAPVIGERYLLQFPGGVERIAEVGRSATDGSPELGPLPFEEPLPGPVLPGGEWLIEPGERLVRDWAGAYWSVAAVGSPPGTFSRTGLPVACLIEFTRFAPSGVLLSYRAESMEWPEQLSDDRLAAVLRRAWETLDTDDSERRRRSSQKRSLISDL